MTTWNQGPGYGYPPPQDPNAGYYGGQPGYPPQGPYPGAMPQPGAYPGMPPQGAYPGGYPGPQGFPGAGYPQGPPPPTGFVNPPPYGGDFNQSQQGGYGGYHDAEGEAKGFDFDDRSIRHGFIRKVYAILMVQLTITLAFIATFLYHIPTKRFIQQHNEIFWIAFACAMVVLIVMACCGDVRRKAPQNFIFLGIFTIAESAVVGIAASYYNSEAVLMAVGITAAVCLGLTIFAFQTRWDFTVMGGIMFVAVIILLIFGLVAMFIGNKIVTLVYASLGALIFSVYLIYDTQLMMGGKHKYSLSPEEYIFAALNLYLDIINIFLYILTIIGASRD